MDGTLPPPIWVDDAKGVTQLISILKKQPIVAVDTESNSLFAYREQVCLVQFSTKDTDYLVDPLTLDSMEPFREIFTDPKIEKVFHAAEYDLICLKRDFNFTVSNLFDTRWAVRVLGYKGDGLERLLSEKFNVKVNKKYQKANWAIRPLSDEQSSYARLDTHYLLPLRDMLKTELEKRELWQLAYEDFQRACKVDVPDGRSALWERVGNQHGFSVRELTILKELAESREQIAERLDRPTFKVVSDKHLFEMTKMLPEHPDDLLGVGLSYKQVKRWGKAFLQAVEKGQAAPLVTRPQVERPNDAFLSRLDELKNWRKKVARAMGVESDVILPRTLMEILAEQRPTTLPKLSELLVDSPWRMTHYGSQLLQILKG